MIEKIRCEKRIPLLGVTVGDFWSWAYSDGIEKVSPAWLGFELAIPLRR